MSEILFIAIDPYILDLVENLQQLIEPTIGLESDYTSGIKRIFDSRPAIVFLQHKIGNVTCDKLANQVKMLLDGETVPLVLMSDESGMSYSVVSTYEACLDLCLPMDELSLQVQRLLRTLPGIAWKESPAPAGRAPEADPSEGMLEISVPIADFGLPFPWQENEAATGGAADPAAGYGTLSALEGNSLATAEAKTPELQEPSHFLVDFLEERFDSEPARAVFEPDWEQEQPAPGPAAPTQDSGGQLRPAGDEGPPLAFGSISERLASATQPGEARPARAAAPAVPAPAPPKTAPPPPDAPPPLTADPDSAAPQAGRTRDDLSEVIAMLDVKKAQPPWYYRGLVVGMLLLISIAALDLLFTLHKGKNLAAQGIDELNAALSVARAPSAPPGTAQSHVAATQAQRATPAPAAAQPLPPFIPQVPPDPGYPASHPGWERYQADAREYLVYREQGSVRAVQVVSEARGAITGAFLKGCIRMSSGHDHYLIRKSERRSGIEVTTCILQNGGELVIYRTVSGGEIRGFVVAFPSVGKAPA